MALGSSPKEEMVLMRDILDLKNERRKKGKSKQKQI